ncbi:MAG TPA: hypothetical protein DCS75_04315 [Gemmatimonadetes bacterium]|nr:hypothetical protein [Gemmatimonadota bacterium]|tara:strand:+ start:8283 stop:8651 length:369 start_codon:yes stop_codon:yes gene_type:complete
MKRLISLALFVVLVTGQYTTASCPMDLGTNNDDRAELANIADAKQQSHQGHSGKTSDSQDDQKGHHGETACASLMNCGTFAFSSAELKSKDLGHRTIGPLNNSLGLENSFKTAIQTPPPRHG